MGGQWMPPGGNQGMPVMGGYNYLPGYGYPPMGFHPFPPGLGPPPPPKATPSNRPLSPRMTTAPKI